MMSKSSLLQKHFHASSVQAELGSRQFFNSATTEYNLCDTIKYKKMSGPQMSGPQMSVPQMSGPQMSGPQESKWRSDTVLNGKAIGLKTGSDCPNSCRVHGPSSVRKIFAKFRFTSKRICLKLVDGVE